MNASASQLIELLQGIAMYNEKGYIWSGHSTAQIEETRASFRRSLVAAVDRVMQERELPTQMQRELLSEEAVLDDSGAIARRFKSYFSAQS